MQIRQEARAETIRRLRTYCGRFERRYERSSEEVLLDVARGVTKETAEISRWLTNYQMLKRLETVSPGPGTGIHTTRV